MGVGPVIRGLKRRSCYNKVLNVLNVLNLKIINFRRESDGRCLLFLLATHLHLNDLPCKDNACGAMGGNGGSGQSII